MPEPAQHLVHCFTTSTFMITRTTVIDLTMYLASPKWSIYVSWNVKPTQLSSRRSALRGICFYVVHVCDNVCSVSCDVLLSVNHTGVLLCTPLQSIILVVGVLF